MASQQTPQDSTGFAFCLSDIKSDVLIEKKLMEANLGMKVMSKDIDNGTYKYVVASRDLKKWEIAGVFHPLTRIKAMETNPGLTANLNQAFGMKLADTLLINSCITKVVYESTKLDLATFRKEFCDHI